MSNSFVIILSASFSASSSLERGMRLIIFWSSLPIRLSTASSTFFWPSAKLAIGLYHASLSTLLSKLFSNVAPGELFFSNHWITLLPFESSISTYCPASLSKPLICACSARFKALVRSLVSSMLNFNIGLPVVACLVTNKDTSPVMVCSWYALISADKSTFIKFPLRSVWVTSDLPTPISPWMVKDVPVFNAHAR